MLSVARVAISALIPSRVTIRPLTRPAAAPTSRPTAGPASAGQPHQPTVTPAHTPARARVEPTERSKNPAIIRSIMPVTRMPFCAALSRTAAMLNRVGKLLG
jgi:hypothetical protein